MLSIAAFVQCRCILRVCSTPADHSRKPSTGGTEADSTAAASSAGGAVRTGWQAGCFALAAASFTAPAPSAGALALERRCLGSGRQAPGFATIAFVFATCKATCGLS